MERVYNQFIMLFEKNNLKKIFDLLEYLDSINIRYTLSDDSAIDIEFNESYSIVLISYPEFIYLTNEDLLKLSYNIKKYCNNFYIGKYDSNQNFIITKLNFNSFISSWLDIIGSYINACICERDNNFLINVKLLNIYSLRYDNYLYFNEITLEHLTKMNYDDLYLILEMYYCGLFKFNKFITVESIKSLINNEEL